MGSAKNKQTNLVMLSWDGDLQVSLVVTFLEEEPSAFTMSPVQRLFLESRAQACPYTYPFHPGFAILANHPEASPVFHYNLLVQVGQGDSPKNAKPPYHPICFG